jgi:hypothetical protein
MDAETINLNHFREVNNCFRMFQHPLLFLSLTPKNRLAVVAKCGNEPPPSTFSGVALQLSYIA